MDSNPISDNAGADAPPAAPGTDAVTPDSAATLLASTQGYLANPQANAKMFDGEWLNTGDLGFMLHGELFLTGREKDIVIRGGFNIHPHELETAVAALSGVRKGGVAVFPASDPRHAHRAPGGAGRDARGRPGAARAAGARDHRAVGRAAGRAGRRRGAGAAAHGAEDLQRQDPALGLPRALRVPLALHGTRSLLRAGAWLPERLPVQVRLLAPIRPAGPGWDAAVAARDAARRALAAELHEPVLHSA